MAWEVEPVETKPGVTPDIRRRSAVAKAAQPAKTKMKADPAVEQAPHEFLHLWLVDHNYDGAAKYVSPRSDACVNLYLAEGQMPPATPGEYTQSIRTALTTMGKDVGKVQHLHDALEPVKPEHDDLKLVEHASERA